MTQVSRPLIGLLVATVAAFAVWTVALKPSSSSNSSSGSSTGLGAYQSAIAKAHQAVATSNATSVAHGGTIATATSPATATATTPAAGTAPAAISATASPAASAHATKATTAAAVSAAARVRQAALARQAARAVARNVNTVEQALRQNKVLALLFFNPLAADDRAVKAELAAVSTHGTKVVKLAVPITELSHFTAVTNQVPVNGSPTLVLIDRARQATTIVGFASLFEIQQRVADALRVK